MTESLTPSQGEQQPMQWMLALAAVVLVSGLLLTWLFIRAEGVSPQAHHDYIAELRGLREADAEINAQLLASRLEITRNYDVLTFQLANAMAASAKIKQVPGFLPQQDRARVLEAAGALSKMFSTKAKKVEAFKRDKAAVRNSLAIFPVLADELLRQDFPGHQPVEAYVRLVLSYAREPAEDRLQQIVAMREQLLATRFSPDRQAAVANLLRHGEIIQRYLPRVNTLTSEIVNLQTASLLEKLNREYLLGHAGAVRVAEFHRMFLYGLAMLLMAYLSYIFINLDRTRRSLLRANREVSERYTAQLNAEARLQLHATAFRNAHEGIVLTDAKGDILDVNPAFTRITGFDRHEVIGRNPRVLKSGRQDDAFYVAMWKQVAEKGSWRGEIWNRNKYGEVFPELLSISAVQDASGALSNYVAVFADISQLKEQEKQLTQMAYYDPLTQLPNRVLLVDRMKQAMSHTRREPGGLMAVCYLDLDGFKQVNDTWGHEVGDQLLIEMADRLRDVLRGGDTVARLGGDEFVLLLLELHSVSECQQSMHRMLQAISQPLQSTPKPMSLSASIGVTLYPNDEDDPDTLLRHADQAMYLAKQAGKNTCHLFDPDHDRSTRSRMDTLKRMAEAIEHEEFVLHYQPKVNMREGRVVGAEALMRWQHPERGLLSPIEFMPLIEEHDLIVRLGHWAIDTALAQVERWNAEGLDLTVSVNVSARHLQQASFVEDLAASLARHPGAAGRLELEVLETTALSDISMVSRIIEESHALGVTFALDDFGTGYSSLTYLKRLPAKTIKIDQSFVREILNDPHNLAIVQGILGLASAFQRRVVAEGVETPEHGRLLLQLECDMAQGHGISTPIPAEAMSGWVAGWKPPQEWDAARRLRWYRDDIPMLVAEVEHRKWIHQLVSALREGQPQPHAHVEDFHTCRFGGWYYGTGQRRYANLRAFQELEPLHQRIHEVASLIDHHWRDGRHEQARELTAALVNQQQAFLAALSRLQLAAGDPR